MSMQIKGEEDVDYIEEETMATIDRYHRIPYTWHLDRIDQRLSFRDGAEFHLDQTGRGVDIYIIDTG